MRGFCFLGKPEGFDGKRHLKIILTEPNSSGRVVVATVTSLKDAKKPIAECILRKGDHPFIRHDSFVDFMHATAMLSVAIISGQLAGELVRKEELAPAVFERVLAVAKSSHKMPPRIRSMLFSSL